MIRRILFVLGVVAAASVFGSRAEAACHAFTFGDGTSASVSEGGKATIVIERDGNVGGSSVRVQTNSGSAQAPSDYTAYDERVTFTTETSKTITIQTREDTADESDERFTVRLSEGDGCGNTNYTYDDPHAVTIKDDDAPAKTVAPTVRPQPTPRITIIPAKTTTPVPTDSATPSPTPTPTGSESPTPSPSGTPAFTPTTIEEDSGFPWLPVLGVTGLLAAAGGALILTRLRGGGV